MKRIQMLALIVFTLCGGSVRAQTTRTATTRTIGVYNADGTGPIDSVSVIETNYGISVVTGSTGTAQLTLYEDEPATILLRKVGYDSVTINVSFQSKERSVLVTMRRSVASLPTVTTVEAAMRTELEERARTFGGKMIAPDELKKPEYASMDMKDALLKNGIRFSDAMNYRGLVGGALKGNQCFPRLIVDNTEVRGATKMYFDDQAQKYTAAEFYPDASRTPEQFADPRNGSCGVLVLWTSVSVYHR